MADLLRGVSPERKEKILARAEELIREERVRRGRFAPPDEIQNAADPFELRRANLVLAAMLAMGAATAIALIATAKREEPIVPKLDCSTVHVEALVPVGELNMGFIYVPPRWEKRLVDRVVCKEWSN